jgi:hypothetical protein
LGQLTGAAIGATVGIIAVAAGGAGVALIVPLTVGGAAIGKTIGGLFPPIKSGMIKKGSPNTFYGPERRNAARAMDPIECNDPAMMLNMFSPMGMLIQATTGWNPMSLVASHSGQFVAEGVFECRINTKEAARLSDRTSCKGDIADGIKTVLIGGTPFSVVPREEQSEDSAPVEWGLWVIDWAAALVGLSKRGWQTIGGVALKAAGGLSEKILGKNSWVTYGLGVAEKIVTAPEASAVELITSGGELAAKGYDTATAEKNLPSTPEMDRRRKALLKEHKAEKGFFATRYSMPTE